ncbi:hypothetical protein CMI47_01300 [Candidatus Pacearchaeota archaeon]|nr:hypothetical protein [Candidatus Pacearchaeota archaeon]|tara:strand:+ start:1787 stop:2260 length:474 start_codon:yes stop_codon:yes gene_type:complete
MKKRGLSPIIATVLLISLGIILALIIFLWARGVVAESVQKFGEPIENSCGNVNFDAEAIYDDGSYTDAGIHIVNRGNVGLAGVVIKEKGAGSLKEINDGKYTGVAIKTGETKRVGVAKSKLDSDDEIVVVPILIGESDEFKQIYVCGDEFGKEITVT